MTTYTAIADSEIDVDSPITESLMTRLRDNPIAIAEGATGAPKIQTGGIQDGAITTVKLGSLSIPQGSLKTTTGEVTVSSSVVGSHYTAAVPGGEYAFSPYVKHNTGSGFKFEKLTVDSSNTSYSGLLAEFIWTGTNSRTGYLQARYIQASPPYDLGDGEVGAFTFLEVDNNGDVVRTWSAPDAPWHFWGKHKVTATHYKMGGAGKIRHFRRMRLIEKEISEGAKFSPETILDRMHTDPVIEVELSKEAKHANMSEVPHPPGMSGHIIMIDPVSELSHKIKTMHDSGAFCMDLFHDGHLKLHDEVVRKGPPGVKIYGAKFKNTKRGK